MKSPVLERAFDYWKSVDADTGKQIEELVRAGLGGANPGGDADDAKVVDGPDRRDGRRTPPTDTGVSPSTTKRYAVCPVGHTAPLVAW